MFYLDLVNKMKYPSEGVIILLCMIKGQMCFKEYVLISNGLKKCRAPWRCLSDNEVQNQ